MNKKYRLIRDDSCLTILNDDGSIDAIIVPNIKLSMDPEIWTVEIDLENGLIDIEYTDKSKQPEFNIDIERLHNNIIKNTNFQNILNEGIERIAYVKESQIDPLPPDVMTQLRNIRKRKLNLEIDNVCQKYIILGEPIPQVILDHRQALLDCLDNVDLNIIELDENGEVNISTLGSLNIFPTVPDICFYPQGPIFREQYSYNF